MTSVVPVGRREVPARIASTRRQIATMRTAVIEIGHPNTLSRNAHSFVVVGLPEFIGADSPW